MNAPIAQGLPLVIVLVVLVVVAAVTVGVGQLGRAWPVVVAAGRAAGQLAAVSLVILAVLDSVWWAALFLAVMVAVATVTSAGRVASVRTAWRVVVPIVAGVVPVVALLLGSGVVAARPVVLVPVGGILVGGAMTATSLAGRRALDELHTRRGEYEAALALGFLPRSAAILICRPTAGTALVPGMDQTRTVGLVTLPGAFVGVLLGGGSPVQAGLTQLVVLISLLAVQAIAVLVSVELVATGSITAPRPAAAVGDLRHTWS